MGATKQNFIHKGMKSTLNSGTFKITMEANHAPQQMDTEDSFGKKAAGA
jgi:hypothetical protein